MNNFVKHFRRVGDGRWTCFKQAELDTHDGPIQVAPGTTLVRGTKFINYDIAAMLDALHRVTVLLESAALRSLPEK